jgi:Tfp pilus assembly protein PilE
MQSQLPIQRIRRPLTLVELIAALILISILGAILAPFLQGILQQTNTGPAQTAAAIDLLTIMERIENDYESDAELRMDLEVFRDRILEDPSPYGTDFSVEACSFITFVDGEEVASDSSEILKVIISNEGSILAQLFTKCAE